VKKEIGHEVPVTLWPCEKWEKASLKRRPLAQLVIRAKGMVA
jgi:hypothetical protein